MLALLCFSAPQIMFAMRELSGPLSLLIEMVTYCSYCNEPFSLGVLQLLKVGQKNHWKLLSTECSRFTFSRVCGADPARVGSTS